MWEAEQDIDFYGNKREIIIKNYFSTLFPKQKKEFSQENSVNKILE